MRRRLLFTGAIISFLALLSLLIWQGSFNFGDYGPSNPVQTAVIWAVSIIIFLLTVVLGFMLFRTTVKVYFDRQSNRVGSRIRSKLLAGALALTITPVLFSLLFSINVLNRNLSKWFSQPSEKLQRSLENLSKTFRSETEARVRAEADWLSLRPEVRAAVIGGEINQPFFNRVCKDRGISGLQIIKPDGSIISLCQPSDKADARPSTETLRTEAAVRDGDQNLGQLVITSALSVDIAGREAEIKRYSDDQKYLAEHRKYYQSNYFLLVALITLFVLFFATWVAQFLARQISVPISALLGAAEEVRRGNLSYRIQVRAIDELATLVRAFNQMTSELEANARELEARRQFTEAILESIPTGVISVSDDGRIEKVNRALSGILPNSIINGARRLEDIFTGADLAEVRYLMNRARRTGAAGSQMQIENDKEILHIALTVASLEERRGFVLVLEDTSEVLQAQKAAAWQEVARRIAHEIKNPLTPISLCADRIARLIPRAQLTSENKAIFTECAETIQQEVQTVKTLVDEFSQFSRFPAAQLQVADLNEIIEAAMGVFAGRLGDMEIKLNLASELSLVFADREQMKRVIVNLIDNAAEAMNESPVKRLLIQTSQAERDTVEMIVADTGCGVSKEDREKLFLPYFSTKERGTGLGLAIVSHIIAEHHGRIRVENNSPQGTQFVVELPTLAEAEEESIQPAYKASIGD